MRRYPLLRHVFSRSNPGALTQGVREAVLLLVLATALAGAHYAWRPPEPVAVPEAWPEGVGRIGMERVALRVARREAILLDARAEAAWRTGRIPGALPFPAADIDAARKRVLPFPADPDALILVYCGQTGCRESLRVAAHLVAHGFRRVFVLEDGFDAWRAAGRAWERSDDA